MGTSRCHPGLRWNLPGFKRGLVVLTCHLLRLSQSVFLLPGFLCREAWKPLHPPSHPHEKWSRKEYLIAFSIPLFLSFLGYVVKIEMMTWAVEQLEDGVNYYAICERMEIEWNNNFFFFTTLALSASVCENSFRNVLCFSQLVLSFRRMKMFLKGIRLWMYFSIYSEQNTILFKM